MENWDWIIVSLGCAVIGSFVGLVNQYFKQDGLKLAFASSLMLSIVWFPISFTVTWPENPLFYVWTICAALAFTVGDIYQFNSSRMHGAGMNARLKTLVLPLVFLIWLPLSPFMAPEEQLLATYATDIPRTLGIACVIAAICISTFSLAKSDPVSRTALLFLLPGIIGIVTGNLFGKAAVEAGNLLSVIVLYNFVLWSTKVAGLLIFLAIRGQLRPVLATCNTRDLWLAAGVFTLIALAFNPLKNVAFALTPHPAYAMVMFQLSPFIISLIYAATGHRETGNVKGGLLLVCLSMLLILLTAS